MSVPVPDVAANLSAVRARITAAAHRSGRDPCEVTLVGATKTVPPALLRRALAAGLVDLGENRAQELLGKAPGLAGADPPPSWHFLGRLQRNKVAALARWVTLWHAIDRIELGVVLARRAPGARLLVSVNIGGEPQKGGCSPASVPGLVDELHELGLGVAGLMTVPPQDHDPRPYFAAVRDIGARLALEELSMGMSQDYEMAIDEGATIVRVGRAIFGERDPHSGESRQ
ncbi:MAG TPA: YggS family pyridoxal phosphate-dependent enzyme [Acidimicrobiia bacterium]|nr:YggS family pyridoxal phosphate-dependent enzyme [Acidimicrobiia bacterium]